MRWWAGGWLVAGAVVLTACGGSAGDGPAATPSGTGTTGSGTTGSGTTGSGTTGSGTTGSGTAGSSTTGSGTAGSSTTGSGTAGSSTTGPGTTGSSTTGSGSGSTSPPSASADGCAAGHTEVAVAPGAPARRRLCVRPGTVVSLVLEPRTDDRRWTGVHSSAPVFVLPSGWRVDPDGTARASLRCAGTRGGTAEVTASAKAPDVAGAAGVAFTLDVSVVPYPREG